MNESNYTIEPIGIIRSTLTGVESAPLQGDEGAPDAWLELTAAVAQGLVGITVGDVPTHWEFIGFLSWRPTGVG